MGFRNPIVGGTSLIRSAIKSPDYVPGSAGWTINKDGTAEFNGLTVRGTFNGTDYTVDEDGIFFYGGPPASGNMTGSWAPMDGTDPYGNSYSAGLTLYSPVGQVFLGGLDGVIQSVGSSGSTINIEDGQYSFGDPGDWNIGLMIQNLDRKHGSYYIASGSQNVADVNTLFGIVTSYGAPVAGQQDTYPRTSTAAYSGSVAAHHYVSGAVIKSSLNGNVGEVWHAPAMGTGWATGPGVSGSYPPLKHHLLPFDAVWVHGSFKATSTAPGGVIASGLPVVNMTTLGGVASAGCAAKVSASSVEIPLYLNSTGELRHAGLPATVAVNDTFMVNAIVPLGNIA